MTEAKPFGLGVVLGSRQVGVRRPRGIKPHLDSQRRRIWRFLGAPHTVGGEDIFTDIAVQEGFKDVELLEVFPWRRAKAWKLRVKPFRKSRPLKGGYATRASESLDAGSFFRRCSQPVRCTSSCPGYCLRFAWHGPLRSH